MTYKSDLIAGGAGGVAIYVVGVPFETIKTRLRTMPPKFYVSTFDCIEKTWKSEGVPGFYGGTTGGDYVLGFLSRVVFRAVSISTFHGLVKTIQSRKDPSNNRVTHLELILTGAVTGGFISILETPIDLIKKKLFLEKRFPKARPRYRSAWGCIIFIRNTYGPAGLWQGLTATTIRNVPANAFFFPVNEISKRQICKYYGKRETELTIPERVFCGAAAGLGYWLPTYPLDVIKGHMQGVSYGARKSWMSTARSIYAEGGVRAFYSGIGLSITRALPACAAMFVTVDLVRKYYEDLGHQPKLPDVRRYFAANRR